MTDHMNRFIFVQSMGKPIVESLVTDNVYKEMTNDEILKHISWWCHKLYNLAGELGPQEQESDVPQEQKSDVERMPPATTNKYIKGIRKCVQNEDGPGLLELYDELNNGQRLWVTRKLYSDDAAAATKLIKMARDAENQPDPNFELYEEVLSEKDQMRSGK